MRVIINSLPDIKNPDPSDFIVFLDRDEVLGLLNNNEILYENLREKLKESLRIEDHYHSTVYVK